jgi:protein gp37
VPRRRTKTFNDPIRWNREAELTGVRPRVFGGSLMDVFDNEVPDEWRSGPDGLWSIVRRTPYLHWIFLTKRIGNARKMLPSDWPFPNAGLMITVGHQDEFDRDYPKLCDVPAPWYGISAEPLLGPIDIGDAKPDWIITGGESGPNHRLTDPDWVRSLRDQCARNGIAFHFKQWGGVNPKVHGCDLDGREHKDFPPMLMAA